MSSAGVSMWSRWSSRWATTSSRPRKWKCQITSNVSRATRMAWTKPDTTSRTRCVPSTRPCRSRCISCRALALMDTTTSRSGWSLCPMAGVVRVDVEENHGCQFVLESCIGMGCIWRVSIERSSMEHACMSRSRVMRSEYRQEQDLRTKKRGHNREVEENGDLPTRHTLQFAPVISFTCLYLVLLYIGSVWSGCAVGGAPHCLAAAAATACCWLRILLFALVDVSALCLSLSLYLFGMVLLWVCSSISPSGASIAAANHMQHMPTKGAHPHTPHGEIQLRTSIPRHTSSTCLCYSTISVPPLVDRNPVRQIPLPPHTMINPIS